MSNDRSQFGPKPDWKDYYRNLYRDDAAGWKANSRIGHCLINRTQKDAVYIEVGTRSPHETAVYPDIDMRAERDKTGQRYVKKTGEPYPVRKA